MHYLRSWIAAAGAVAILTGTALAQVTGGIPIGDIAPDLSVMPWSTPVAALSQLQGTRALLLVAFKST